MFLYSQHAQNGTYATGDQNGGGTGPPVVPSFPSVVASVNYTEQTGNLSFNLLDNPVTGDYVLNDVLQIEVGDSGATVFYTVSWMGDGGVLLNGFFSDGEIPPATAANPVAVSQGTLLSESQPQWDGTNVATPPTVIHAVAGTPISVSIELLGATTLQYSYHATLVRNQ